MSKLMNKQRGVYLGVISCSQSLGESLCSHKGKLMYTSNQFQSSAQMLVAAVNREV